MLPSWYAGAKVQPPIQLLVLRFQQQCAAVTMMLLGLMMEALQYPPFRKSLPEAREGGVLFVLTSGQFSRIA